MSLINMVLLTTVLTTVVLLSIASLTVFERCTVPTEILSASSRKSSQYDSEKAAGVMKRSYGLWCLSTLPGHRAYPRLNVQFYSVRTIIGLRLTGGGVDYTSNELEGFTVRFSEDFKHWSDVRVSHEDPTVKVFDGLTSADIAAGTVKEHIFPYMIPAKHLLIKLVLNPNSSYPCLKLDFLQPSEFCEVTQPLDLLFLLENQEKWTEESFGKVKDFVIDVISNLPLESDTTRVGLQVYGSTIRTPLYLDNEMDLSEMTSVIEGITLQTPGAVRLDSALEFLNTELLREERGDRLDVPNSLIIVTNGDYTSTEELESITQKAQLVHGRNTTVYAVCLDSTITSPETLHAIASDPHISAGDPPVETANLGSYQYLFSAQKRTYDSANTYCQQFNGSLASIHSLAEKQFLEEQAESISERSGVGACVWWIGLHGSQYWSDGTVLDLNLFSPPEPYTGSVYVKDHNNWFWTYSPIQERQCFICKYSAKSVNIQLISDKHVLSIQENVTFAILYHTPKVANSYLELEMEGQENRVLQLNLRLSFNQMYSEKLSKFGLSSTFNRMKYKTTEFNLTEAGSFIATVSSNNEKSTPQVITVIDRYAQCFGLSAINGTGRVHYAPVLHELTQDSDFSIVIESVCEGFLSMTWSLGVLQTDNEGYDAVDITDASHFTITNSSLHVKGYTLLTKEYRICCSVLRENGSMYQYTENICGYVKMINTPLVLVLSPNTTFISLRREEALVLDASSSYNPNSDRQTDFKHSWSCSQKGGRCDFVDKVWPGQNVQGTLPSSGLILTIPPSTMTEQETYDFTVDIYKTGLVGSSHTVSVFIDHTELLLRCLSGCGGSFESSVSLHVDCSDCLGTVTYRWSIEEDGGSVLDDTIWMPFADLQHNVLLLPAGIFNPLKAYTINVQGTADDGYKMYAAISVPSKDLVLLMLTLSYSIYLDTYNKFLILTNSSTSPSVQITSDYMCVTSTSVVSPSARSTYPLSTFSLSSTTDGMSYSVIGHLFMVPGMYNITASMAIDSGQVFRYTIPVKVLNEDDHHCLASIQIIGTGRTPQTAKIYTLGQHVHFSSMYTGSCVDLVVVSYNWTAYHDAIEDPQTCRFEDDFQIIRLPEADDTRHSESLHIPPKLLILGYSKFCLEIVFVSSSREQHKNSGCGYVKMINQPLVTSLSPDLSHLSLPINRELVLNASLSFNPNSDDQTDFQYSWSCQQNGGDCDFVETVWRGQNVHTILPVTDAVLTMPAYTLILGETYDFSVAVSKTGLEGSDKSISVLITTPTTPTLLLRCKFGCGVKLNPSELLALEVECSNCNETGLLVQSYTWSFSSRSTNHTISPQDVIPATTTGIHQSTFVLSAYFLNASDTYSISVTGVNSMSEIGTATQIVTTNSPPIPGTCMINPESGKALLTHFTIVCLDFEDTDSPLVYKVYLENEDQKTSQLLFHGFESTISHLTFPTGYASRNYTHNITISVFDAYKTSTSVHIAVQVLSPQESNQSVSEFVHNLILNNTVDDVHDEERQDVLKLASNVAVILNDQHEDQKNVSVIQRAEFWNILKQVYRGFISRTQTHFIVRETLLTKLTQYTVDNQDVLQQMTEVVEDFTTRTEEVTESIQDLAVNVSSQLTDTLGIVAQQAPTVAKTIAVKQLSTLENLMELTVTRDTQTLGAMDGEVNDTTSSVDTKAIPILNLYEKIGDAMLKGIQFGNEEPLRIQAKKTALAVLWSPLQIKEMVDVSSSVQGGEVEGRFHMLLNSSLGNIANTTQKVGDVNFQVQLMSVNPYVWDQTVADVNMPVVSVLMKSRHEGGDRLQLTNLTQPASIFFARNISTLTGEVNKTDHGLNVTVENHIITSSGSQLVRVASNGTLIIRLKSLLDNITLTALAVTNNTLSAEQIIENGYDLPIPPHSLQTKGALTQDPYSLILPKLEGNRSYYTVGYTVKTGQILESHKRGTAVVDISLETHTVSCSYWDDITEEWGSSGCQVGYFTTVDRLHCMCDHLTAFSGGFFVAPNTVDPIGDIILFLQFFDNPVVVTAMLAVWGLYLLILYWARQKDKEDTKKVGMTVLRDNDPGDSYVYLICVVTSWWPQAGTTANIFLYLRSRYNQSARHMLADPQRKLFTPGAENWFVLTTPERLGKIKSVVVWHDNRGKNPSWLLKEVVVYDMKTKEEWHCLYNDWLAVDQGPGFLQTEIPCLRKSDMINRRLYQLGLKASQDFRNGHLWISIFSKPAYNHFTRAQRLTCGLSLLLTTMLSSIMFFGVPTDDPADQYQSGGVVISLSGIVIGIQSGLLMFPINTLIIQFFMRTAPKESLTENDLLLKESGFSLRKSSTSLMKRKGQGDVRTSQTRVVKSESGEAGQKEKCQLTCCVSKQTAEDMDGPKSNGMQGSVKGDEVDVGMSRGDTQFSEICILEEDRKNKTKEDKKPFRFPWWFVYITWTVCLSTCVICSYFVMLYGLKYGYQKSVDWTVSFFTAFAQSALVTQPIKVMVIAVLITQILKRPVEYESWGQNQDLEDEELEKLTDHKPAQGRDSFNRYYVPPVTVSVLEQIRKQIQLDKKARMILYEIALYFTFVACVLLMIYGHRNIDGTYMVTRTTENMFTVAATGFKKVSTVDSMWKYLQNHFVNNLVTDSEGLGLTSCQASFLMGKARLRQLRIRSGICNHPQGMETYAHVPCTGSYWITDEDTQSYNNTWAQPLDSPPYPPTAYTHQSAFQLVTLPFVGKLATYSGGGFVQELPKKPNDSRAVLSDLANSDWIDQHTRSVFVEFSLYNPNVNLFTMVVLVFEMTNFGGVFPYYQIFTSNLYHYSGGFQIFVAVCEAMFLLYLIAFTYLEVKKFRRMTSQEYFEDVWSYVEIIILALSYTVLGLFIQRLLSVSYSLQLYRESKGQSYVSFHPAASSNIILQYVMASLSMFIIVKFFKLLRFNVRMSLLAGTLKRCRGLLLQFSIKVFIYTIAFSSFGVLVFSTQLEGYSNFGESIITLLNFVLGASDYFGLEGASKTLGPVFFFVFSCLYQFILIMVFCSILMDGYASMMRYILSVKTEVHMVDFISKKLKLLTINDKKQKNTFRRKMYEISTDR